jgi:hypothetical protein
MQGVGFFLLVVGCFAIPEIGWLKFHGAFLCCLENVSDIFLRWFPLAPASHRERDTTTNLVVVLVGFNHYRNALIKKTYAFGKMNRTFGKKNYAFRKFQKIRGLHVYKDRELKFANTYLSIVYCGKIALRDKILSYDCSSLIPTEDVLRCRAVRHGCASNSWTVTRIHISYAGEHDTSAQD